MPGRLLRRGPLLRSPTATATVPVRLCTSAFNKLNSYYITTSTATNTSTEEQNPKDDKKGKWFTLPPFTPQIDGSSLGKEISGRPIAAEGCGTSTTAIKWVLRCCPQLPRSLVQKLFRLRQVRRESSSSSDHIGVQEQECRLKRVAAKESMNLGDKIFLPISVREFPTEKNVPNCNVDEMNFIRSLEMYKDPSIIVVNKPHGMPVQGGVGIKKSLDELAATYLQYENLEPPRLVHRLDRDSSGVLVMGRTQTSTTVLHSIFREKTFGASDKDVDNRRKILQRKYWALVVGSPRRPRGVISASLGKVVVESRKSERITTLCDAQTMSCQHAITEYRVIKPPCHGYTWLELSPLTGRKHQLRVHCAEVLGTPIVGDYKYGWQAHKNLSWSNFESDPDEKLTRAKTLPFGLDLERGSISEKKLRLHLHCKQMVLPNVCLALQNVRSSLGYDVSELESLEFVAPLPSHMQRSWDILSS